VDYWIPWPIPIPCPAKSSRPWRDPGPTWPTPSSSPPGTGRALAVVAFPLSLRVGPGRATDAREPKPRPHISSQMVILAGKKKRSRDLPPHHTHMHGHGKARSLSFDRAAEASLAGVVATRQRRLRGCAFQGWSKIERNVKGLFTSIFLFCSGERRGDQGEGRDEEGRFCRRQWRWHSGRRARSAPGAARCSSSGRPLPPLASRR